MSKATMSNATFSPAVFFRHCIALIESRGETMPGRMFRLAIPPGVDCHPDLHKLAAEYNAAIYRAGKAASRHGDDPRGWLLGLIRPLLREHLARAEAIESAQTTETRPETP